MKPQPVLFFEPKNQKKHRHFTSVSRETDKKKRRFLAKTNQVKQCVSLQSKTNQASKPTQAIKAKQSKQTKPKQAFQTNEPNQSKISKQTKEKRKPSQLKANKGK